jgi:hypothetical protein
MENDQKWPRQNELWTFLIDSFNEVAFFTTVLIRILHFKWQKLTSKQLQQEMEGVEGIYLYTLEDKADFNPGCRISVHEGSMTLHGWALLSSDPHLSPPIPGRLFPCGQKDGPWQVCMFTSYEPKARASCLTSLVKSVDRLWSHFGHMLVPGGKKY